MIILIISVKLNGEMILNALGNIAYRMWEGLPKVFEDIGLDVFIVMPNHIHGILAITKVISVGDAYSLLKANSHSGNSLDEKLESSFSVNMRPLPRPDRTKMYLSKIIRIYKSAVSKRVNVELRKSKKTDIKLWQRSFYDRIIRNEKEFYNIQGYIYENPVRWEFDSENKNNLLKSSKNYYR